ncbi:hypothetical protein H0H87_006685 [Tephrocybe sp. NHM501043]|nr:hypothetical protein H0H87_006685 [Tephrocybe sp. NHM501043]
MSNKATWKKILESDDDKTKISRMFKEIDEQTKNFHLKILLTVERAVRGLGDSFRQLLLNNWPYSRTAQYNTDLEDAALLARRACSDGTRVHILERISQWAQDSSPLSPQVFWLTGQAGSGKSTIAYSVAQDFDEGGKWPNLLQATFFCSRQFKDTRSRNYIIPTVVYQLARRSKSFAHALLNADKEDSVNTASKQMKDLFVNPWKESAHGRSPDLPPYLVIIDALDEIDDQGGSKFLKDLLTVVNAGELHGLKFLVTSHPDPGLAALCKSFSTDAVCCLFDVAEEEIKGDITKYLQAELPMLKAQPRFAELVTQSNDLFIYASTAVRYILRRGHTTKQQCDLMHKLLDSINDHKTLNISRVVLQIDLLYQQILSYAFSELEENHFQDHLCILHTILCTQERTSSAVIAGLLDSNIDDCKDQIDSLVNDLHAVLYVKNGCIFWYHASFPDFIFTQTRSKFSIPGTPSQLYELSCDPTFHHEFLAKQCFSIMMSGLHFNICDHPSSFLLDSEVPGLQAIVDQKISNGLKYSCMYWAQHMIKAGYGGTWALIDQLREFLSMHVLFWMEAMNLMQQIKQCITMLQLVQAYVKVS